MAATVHLTQHADVVAVATDPASFASRTSTHLHVPNGMDGDQHRAYRAVVERYMTAQAVDALEPMLRDVAAEIVGDLPRGVRIDVIGDVGEPFAVRAQCRWLGWPASVEPELLAWMADNYAASQARDPERNAAVAASFDAIVRREIDRAEPDSTTGRLARDTVDGRPLTGEEVVSILRNWTAGDLGSLARCIGVIVRRLADEPPLQLRVRLLAQRADGGAELESILNECLRIEDPFVANRRRATCPVTLPSGQAVEGGDTVMLEWVAANRDPAVFGDGFDAAAHAADNLVFGIGPHVCPGQDLSLAELRIAIVALMDATDAVEPAAGASPVPHAPPLGGWASVPIVLR